MKHFKHILATTDLSAESLSAVQYAAHLARGQGARLTILHVQETMTLAYAEISPPVNLLDLDSRIEAAARAKLEAWLRSHGKGLAAKIVIKKGVIHQTICDTATAVGASAIVMATHGRKGLKHVLLGSVTERVLRYAPCPVLVVRPPEPAAKKKSTAIRKAA